MQDAVEEQCFLTDIAARALLQEQGYDMVCPFGHIHAMQGNQQWHLCMRDALATMDATHLLACLEDALRFSERIHGPLLPLVETLSARG